MKKVYLLFCLLVVVAVSKAQPLSQGPYSPNGIFDKVFDRFGNGYNLPDIQIMGEAGGGLPTTRDAILCTPGYFNLYFEIGSGMEGTSAAEVSRRNVICQVFSDISAFINSPLTASGNRVNIWVRDIGNIPGVGTPSTSGILGLATTFYTAPGGAPTSTGIVDGEIWKTIISGQDSYTNVVSPLLTQGGGSFSTGSTFYHGMVAFNFSNPAFNWHTSLTSTTPAGFIDMYTIALHEVTHALGFASLINFDGGSKLLTNFNYYSRYDMFLKTQAGQSLITNSGACSLYNWQFNPAIVSAINTLSPNTASCPGGVPPSSTSSDNTVCANAINYVGGITQNVYTPNCFEPPSSLSHFEDECQVPATFTPSPPASDNLYFVMSNANGSGIAFMKRFLKPEERTVLCDLGYNVNTTYGSIANFTFHNYGGTACPGLQVGGLNDGITTGGSYAFTTATTVPTASINPLTNDYNATSFECLQVVIGSGTLSTTSGTNFTYTPSIAGTHLLRYIPVNGVGQRGNITYIYVRVNSGSCVATACNMINNGGFENGISCGQTFWDPAVAIDCWSPLTDMDYYVRGCLPFFDPGITVPSAYSTPPSDSWSGTPNDKFLSFWIQAYGTTYNGGVVETDLNATIAPGASFTISFWGKIATNFSTTPNNPMILEFSGSPGPLVPLGSYSFTSLPAGMTPLGLAPTVPADNQWHFITAILTNTSAITLNSLQIVGAKYNNPSWVGGSYLYVDDFQMDATISAPSFTPPATVCITETLPDLSAYTTVPGGVFTGPGVTCTAGVCSFDAGVAGLGLQTITFTYTNSLGCVVSTYGQINVVSGAFTINATASPSTICSGQTTTLTADIGLTGYVWSPGAGLTTNPVTVSPAGTTVYTVNASSGACPGTGTVTVTVNPSPTVTVNSPSICAGQTANLTAGGATSYTWSAGATSTGTATATATPSVTTTYTVTGTSGGCTGTAISTVTVTTMGSPPTVTLLYNPICTGSTNTLTSSTTSNWYNAASGGTLLAGSTTTFTTPALGVTTTYYVSSIVGGCESARVAVTVTVVACCTPSTSSKVLLPTYTSGITTITGGGYWIAAGLITTINPGATLIFDGIKLNMSPNYKIVVKPGGKLIIKNGSKIWGCTSYMWDGIDVEASSTIGGRIEINTDTEIEDAKIAVHIMNSTVQAEFDIHHVTFNKNNKGIVVDPFAGTHLGIIYSTNFRSQASTTAFSPNVASAFTSPYLKAPFAVTPGRRSAKGIEITSVGTIKIGTPGGAGTQNLFANQEIGIHSSVNTNLYSINNKFLNIQYGSCGFFCIIPNTGFAIVANNGGSVTVGGATTTANIFKGCYYGIRINNNVSLDCQLNSFTTIGNNPIFPGKCIYITNVNFIPFTIKTNTFKDFITGVEINNYNKCTVNIISNDFKQFDFGTGVYALTNINSNLNVITNTFNNTAVDFGNTAIRVQNAVISLNGTVQIQTNDIRNCNIGIKTTKISGAIIDQINQVKFVLSSPPGVPNYGVWVETCPNSFVKNNLVYKSGAITAGSTYNNLLYGYSFTVGNTSSRILDNVVTRMNTGFQFAGSNSLLTDGFGCNFINYNYTGLELNTTSIGNQGSTLNAHDNQWQLPSSSTYVGTFGIRKIPSTAATPIFYSRSAAHPWALTPFEQLPTASVTFSPTGAGLYDCLHGCLTPPFCPKSASSVVKMAKKMSPYDSLAAGDIDITYTNTYADLKTDSTLYTTGTVDDAVVINFKDSLALTNVGKLYEVIEKIVDGDTTNARIINDAVVPKDCKEQSQQIVNKIYTSTWARGEFEFTPPDSAILLTIANYTVEACGLAVFDARVMLRIDINDYPIEEDRSMIAMPQTNDVIGVMYPNPANTVAYYEIELAENQTGFVELFDLLGNMVASQKLNTGTNKAEIDLTQLANGVYVYKVIINNEFRASNKLIITK